MKIKDLEYVHPERRSIVEILRSRTGSSFRSKRNMRHVLYEVLRERLHDTCTADVLYC